MAVFWPYLAFWPIVSSCFYGIYFGIQIDKAKCMTKLQYVTVFLILGIISSIIFDIAIFAYISLAIAIVATIRLKENWIKIGLLAWCAGVCIHASQPKPSLERPLKDCMRIIEGKIVRPPRYQNGHTRLHIQTAKISDCQDSKILPVLNTDIRSLHATIIDDYTTRVHNGDTIRFASRCRILRTYSPHFNQPPSPSNRITTIIPDVSHIALIESPISPVETWLQQRRLQIVQQFESFLNNSNSRLAKALILGQSDSLTQEQKTEFRQRGISHILAVSGLHLGIIAIFCYGISLCLLRRCSLLTRRYDASKFAAILCLFPIIGFTMLTGAAPPIMRACVMTIFVLCSKIFCHNSNPLQAISLAACLILCREPQLIETAGFQLSFVTVVAFFVFLGRHHDAANDVSGQTPTQSGLVFHKISTILMKYIKSLLVVSILAAIVCAPFVAFHFQSVPLCGPFFNMLIVPVVSLVIMPLLLFATVLGQLFPAANSAVMPLCDQMLDLLSYGVSIGESFAIHWETLNILSQAVVALISLGLLLAFCKRFRLAATAIATGLVLLGVYWQNKANQFPQNSLVIDFLDVGQGDSTLITFPNGSRWLVDAGGTAHSNIGSHHIVPILQSIGVGHLEKIVLTHPDPDHLLGIPDILHTIAVDEIWDNGQGVDEPTHEAYAQMITLAKQKHIPIKRSRSICGVHWVDKVRVEVVHPCFPNNDYEPSFSFNDNSIVLRLSFHEQSIFLPGDLSYQGEQHLLETYLKRKKLWKHQLLKLGHHGSNSSTSLAFLQKLRPQQTVVSCGFQNQYRFPNKQVRQRLKEAHISLYRTDLQGWIRYISKKDSNRIITQKKTP